jgi:hypothetical protein
MVHDEKEREREERERGRERERENGRLEIFVHIVPMTHAEIEGGFSPE